MQDENHWRIDRHVPVALIITLIGGMISGAFYFGGITSNHENRIKNLEEVLPEVRTLSKDITEIKTHLPYIRDSLNDLNHKIDKATEDTNDVSQFLRDKVEWVDAKKAKK